jgi:anti-sigma factor RsiW
MENTKCLDIEPLLDGYFDNELQESESSMVKAHLFQCAHCSAQLAEIQVVSKGLAAMPRLSLGKDLSPQIMDKLKSGKQGKVLIFKRKEVWAVAAGCLILGLAFQFFSRTQVQVTEVPLAKPVEKIAEKENVAPKVVATTVPAKQKTITPTSAVKDGNVKPRVLIASSTNDDVLAFDYGYQPNLMEGMGLATDEDGLYALKM